MLSWGIVDDYVRDLIDELVSEGFEDREHAMRALRATVAVLDEYLAHDEARVLARVLPEEVVLELDRGATEHLTSGRAREERQIVCAAIGRRLTDDEREAIAGSLPEDIADDLRRTLRPAEPMTTENGVPGGQWIASARPGSRHPVSEGRADRAQSESVARSEDPHADTKLSSARGLTQEREHDALAEYRPSPSQR